MFLLRYGIRCIMHYSVPVTLGLLAWNGNWQGVARQVLTESPAKPGSDSAADSPALASKNSTAKPSGPVTDSQNPNSDREGSESIAMNPTGAETTPRGIAVPRADSRGRNETASASDDRKSFSRRSETSETDSRRAPRDRNIDATGHETPIVAAANAGDTKSNSDSSSDKGASEAPAPPVVAAENPPTAIPGLSSAAAAQTAQPNKAENHEDSASPESAHVASTRASTEAGGNSAPESENHAKTADSTPAAEPGVEPADLKPEVRAIAAEVPRPADGSKAMAGSAPTGGIASATEVADAGSKEPNAVPQEPEPAPAVVTRTGNPATGSVPETSTKEGAKPAPISAEANEPVVARMPQEVPEIVVAKTGETWRRIAERVYGDEKMAEAIWKENRDAHGGTSDVPPVAGRLVRLPTITPSGGIPKAGTQLARTAR